VHRNFAALARLLRLQGSCQAHSVEVVAGDLFATRNLLKSHGACNVLSPFSNHHAITSKLCTRLEPVTIKHDVSEILPVAQRR
jgi:hypothetical protein